MGAPLRSHPGNPPLPSYWCVVKTHQGQEKLAQFHLQRQGFETYLPMRIAENRRTKEIGAKPMFPSYLFVHLKAEVARWRAIFSTIGVSSVLATADGQKPAALPEVVVAKLKDQEVGGLIRLAPGEKPDCGFTKGQKVTIDTLIDGVFHEAVDATRVALLISLLGRDSRVVVDLHRVAS